jgi:hypothetical protein
VRLRVLSGTCDTDAIHVAPPDLAPTQFTPPTFEPTAPPSTRAVVSRLRLSPSHFRVRGRRRGTTISFTLNRAVRVSLRFERLRSGRRHAGRCSVRAHHGRRCTVTQTLGGLAHSGRRGTNRIHFSGTLKGRRLARGSYRLSVTPLGGRVVRARFTVR